MLGWMVVICYTQLKGSGIENAVAVVGYIVKVIG